MAIPNRTFGVEIELCGLDRDQAADVLSRAGLRAEAQSYNHDRFNGWKVVRDSSIVESPGFLGTCEVVSPVLRGEAGLAEIRQVCQVLARAGARVNRSCGLHVHVGTNGLTANDVGMILSRYARFETVIDSWMPASRRENRNFYCNSIVPIVNSLINNRNWTNIFDVVSQFAGNRYYKVNMNAYLRHRTIEFRHHGGTVNAGKIENWIRFLLAFIEASKERVAQIQMVSSIGASAHSNSHHNRNRRCDTAPRRRNSIESKLDNLILAFRSANNQHLSLETIATIGGWSVVSVPAYISRLRRDRGCQIIRRIDGYALIGNSGRLYANLHPESSETSTPAVTIETRRAARRLVGVAHLPEDSVYHGIPSDVVSYFEERAAELGDMGETHNHNGGRRFRRFS